MGKSSVTHAIIVIILIMITLVVICFGNGEFQNTKITESLTTSNDHNKIEKAIAKGVEGCLHLHDEDEMEYCIFQAIIVVCKKHSPRDEDKTWECIKKFVLKYYYEGIISPSE
ncbi:hypothetical protein PIB30_074293 [Stylosanthes scabra]|uniref:Transmembrane protein n=1 Tax=Stylosanthes scabra TaxID=79078 RepID=A0ABU6TR49_9FABA|nr:hypothetical protein [Stylosanthes scabra]